MKRSPNTGMIKDIAKLFPEKRSLDLFKKMGFIRSFEKQVEKAYNQGLIKAPIYLSTGQESIASALSLSFLSPKIFAQHRNHDFYLAYGANPIKLVDELIGLPSGCAGGMGGSASIHSPEIGMFGHDGFMGTQVPIGSAYSGATKEKTLIVMGDASAEEGYVLEALGFAATQKPPALFICSDNGLSCLTPTRTRRNWNMTKDAMFGLPALEITDDPWLIMYHTERMSRQLPAFINIQTCRVAPHANTYQGFAINPEWDRYKLVKDVMEKLDLGRDVQIIEKEALEEVTELWQSRLSEAKCKTGGRPAENNNRDQKPTLAETICETTRNHCLKDNGGVMGQCLDMAGSVSGTVPQLSKEQGLLDLSMGDIFASGEACGYALADRWPVFVTRYQGFQWFNAAFFANYAAKAKEMWGYECPIFIRSVGMDGGAGPSIGPVASCSHHGLFIRTPGMKVFAPITPKEWLEGWDHWRKNGGPIYCSEYRKSYSITDEIPDIIHKHPHITLFPISITRLHVLEALPLLKAEGIVCNVINIVWLKPFEVKPTILESLKNSRYGGIVLDSDFENAASKCIAFDIMQKIDKKIKVLGLEERTAGFASHLDNLPPTPERIVEHVKKIVESN